MPASPTHRPLRRTALASLAVLALGSLAACNTTSSVSSAGDTSSPALASSLSPSAASTPSTPTSPTAGDSPSSTGPAAGSPISSTAFAALFTKAFANATTAKVTQKYGGKLDVSGSGLADFSTNPPQLQLSLKIGSMGKGTLQERLVDGVLYLQLPTSAGKFYSVNLKDPNNPFGKTFGSSLDPSTAIKAFGAAVTSATYVGQETVEGDSLSHYRAKASGPKLLAAISPSLAKSGASSMPASVSYDVYFDDQGRFRKLDCDLGTLGTTDLEYSDWGTPVHIVKPPAGQVTAFPG